MSRSAPTPDPIDAVVGAILGVLGGGGLGLGACTWLLPGTLLFPGDTMDLGAIVCGALGYYKGDDFLRWLRDHWFD
jgi:hypothetical protein